MIPYGKHDIRQKDIDLVVEVLKSDYLTQGPMVPAFEKCVSEKVNCDHSVAVNSATSALHISCLALGLSDGDWVWTSPITFVASANCALYCGAQVDFVDIDPATYNLDPLALEKKLIKAEIDGRLPKIVIPVHLCGQSADMQKIYKLSLKFGFRIIEDASHAIGGMYDDGHIGDCRYSDITVFSFHPVKIITTAEGGMAVTNNQKLAAAMRLFRSHGVTREHQLLTAKDQGSWYYEQQVLGFNYRMTDLHAALGVTQIERLDGYIEARRVLANRYTLLLRDLPVNCPKQSQKTLSSWHLYVIQLANKLQHAHLFEHMRSAGIGVNIHYIPIPRQPYYQSLGFSPQDFPEAESYYGKSISLPIFPTMTYEEQDYVVDIIKQCLVSAKAA